MEQAKEQARASANAANPGKVVVLFVDAVTVYRQPTVACSYEAQGHTQPLARLSTRTNTQTRVIAGLNGVDGAVVYLRGRVSIERLVQFYRKVCATYPDAECIYVVIDNWPVYVHPDVLVALGSAATTLRVGRGDATAGASQLAQTAECGSATQVGAVGSADPVSTATHLCIVDQSYREAMAQAEAGVGAHAPFGR